MWVAVSGSLRWSYVDDQRGTYYLPNALQDLQILQKWNEWWLGVAKSGVD